MKIHGFIKSEKVYEVLDTAIRTKQNVVLYGPGGYGKSEMTLAFLRQKDYKDEDITIKALSIATTVDDLFGGVNVKKLKEDGVIEYNVANSIFNTPILVLEEAFDAPKRTLEALKDTLTSGYIRNGTQRYKIKTECIIVCTNRSQRELISDASTEALMERFPLSLKVHWNEHKLSDYKELVQTVFNKPMDKDLEDILSYILSSIDGDVSVKPPAPRTVVRMVKIYNTVGLKGLVYLNIPRIDKAIEYSLYTSKRQKRIAILSMQVQNLLSTVKVLKQEQPSVQDVAKVFSGIRDITQTIQKNNIESNEIPGLNELLSVKEDLLDRV